MILCDLIDGLATQLVQGDLNTDVRDLTDDSRLVQPGTLFIARAGTQSDGRQYVEQAIARGAVAVIASNRPHQKVTGTDGRPVAWLVHEKIDQAFAGELAERFWDRPSRKLKLIGVTGTNGKTTTTLIIQHLLNRHGLRCGLMGTIYLDDGHHRAAASLTTPSAIDLSRYLAAMVNNGCKAAVMETSSHALHQGRTAALHFDAAVFTNLTGDHLDYHVTMDDYAGAKAILFDHFSPQAWAIVNADDAYAPRMLRDCKARVSRCSLKSIAREPGDCVAQRIELQATGSKARFTGPWGEMDVRVPLVGRHNVINTLQAVAAAATLVDLSTTLKDDLATCPAVPGRLEPVIVTADDAQPTVLVDYAHTHDALQNVLESLRPLTKGRLIVLFGCGGDRDRTKRPKMAAVACSLADQIMITSDNPRTEDPQTILDEVLTGVPANDRPRVTVQIDRAAAIEQVIMNAGNEDVVLLAGKGHEDYQIIGTTKRHFDDREQAAAALRQRRSPSRVKSKLTV